MLKTKGLPN
jgi:hypothetical protein